MLLIVVYKNKTKMRPLQEVAFLNYGKMGRLGFEPRTNQLKAEYSTVELTTHMFFAQMNFITCPGRSMQQKT
jgi:hypothetical protein